MYLIDSFSYSCVLLIRPWMNFRRAAGFCFLSRLVNFVFHADSVVLLNPVSVDRFRSRTVIDRTPRDGFAVLKVNGKSTARFGTIFH